MTWTLLGVIAGIWILQWIALASSARLHDYLFVVNTDWPLRPWSPITSTFAHATYAFRPDGTQFVYYQHIFFNGLMLYFFGPHLERLWGPKRFAMLFVAAGAVTGIAQVHLSALFGTGGGALGASGALMMLFGALAILAPTMKLLLFFILPVPFWAAAIGYALVDVLGAFHPGNGIGNFAHLAGMAIGLYVGQRTKKGLAERGLTLHYG